MIEKNEEYIHHLEGAIFEMNKVIEEQNAKLIAFDAKLKNEEKKVTELKNRLFFLSQAFTNNTINIDNEKTN